MLRKASYMKPVNYHISVLKPGRSCPYRLVFTKLHAYFYDSPKRPFRGDLPPLLGNIRMSCIYVCKLCAVSHVIIVNVFRRRLKSDTKPPHIPRPFLRRKRDICVSPVLFGPKPQRQALTVSVHSKAKPYLITFLKGFYPENIGGSSLGPIPSVLHIFSPSPYFRDLSKAPQERDPIRICL